MTTRCRIGATNVEAWLADGRLEVLLDRDWMRLRDGFAWTGPLAAGIRHWARICLGELDGGSAWAAWGRRAGRWTLVAEQGPIGGLWTAAYRIGGDAITVASGSVPAIESARCIHGQRVTSEAVIRARLLVEEAVIAWVRAARAALCADLGEASQSGVAA